MNIKQIVWKHTHGIREFLDRYCVRRSRFAKIGKHTQIATPLKLVRANVRIDDHARIQPGTNMISDKGQLVVKKYSSISSEACIIPGAHIPTVGLPQFLSMSHVNDIERTIVVEEDCWVGARAILLSKAHICRGAVVSAGAIVTKEVPPYAVVAGVPAKIVGVRFTLEQVLQHERILYPKEERLEESYLTNLFNEKYQGLHAIGTDEMSEEDRKRLTLFKQKYGIKDYDNN